MTTSPRPPSAATTLRLDHEEGLGRREVLRQVKAKIAPVLVVASGERMGARRVLDRTVTVGRDPACELPLSDASVSWHHARVEDRGDGFAVVDLGSTNGTSVEGERVSERVLVAGQRIAFGDVVVRFELQDALDRQLDAMVQRLLEVDELSGLWVRRKFDAELALALEAARSRGAALALLVMDLDGVKGINDTHGHLFGAHVIGESGRVIGKVVGDRGFCSRFGGDEFIAALPGVDVAGGAKVGEEVRAAIAAHRFELDGVVLAPGISIGVAAYPSSATDATSLFQRADDALYRAKQAGKDRVCT